MFERVETRLSWQMGRAKCLFHPYIETRLLQPKRYGSCHHCPSVLRATSRPSSYLTTEKEWELVTFLCRTAAIWYGWCKKEVIAIVERVLSSCGVERPVTSGWWNRFSTRHPELALRIPSTLSYAQARASDLDSINAYFDISEKTLKENQLLPDLQHG